MKRFERLRAAKIVGFERFGGERGFQLSMLDESLQHLTRCM